MNRLELLATASVIIVGGVASAHAQGVFQGTSGGPAGNYVTNTAKAGSTAGNTVGVGNLNINTNTNAPTLSCGTGSTLDSAATNTAGTVTVTSSATASCQIIFTAPAFPNAVHCLVADQTWTTAALSYSYVTTSITVAATALAGNKIDYFCTGY